jgi:hypothetical protein
VPRREGISAYDLGMNRVTALLLLFIAMPLPAANVRLAPRRNACGISFRAPRGWIVETFRDADDIPCAIGMKPRGWNEDPEDPTDIGDYAITLDVTGDDFDEAAERAGFLRVKRLRGPVDPKDDSPPWPPLGYKDDDWVTMGRMALLNTASPIHSASWSGLMGEITRGYSRRRPDGGSGGNGGMGNVVLASVISRSKPAAAVIIRGGPLQDDAVRAVIRTIQFRRRR